MELKDRKKYYLEAVRQLDLPIFFQPWWLDVVCQNGDWHVCLFRNSTGKVLGVLPFYLQSLLGLKLIRTPPYTPYLGVWLDYSDCSDRNTSKYSFENKVIEELVEQLPKVSWYHQIHPDQLQNWFPFYWRHYRQTTRYTYILEKLNPEYIYENMKPGVRNKIHKAERTGLIIQQKNDLESFITQLKNTFKRQNKFQEVDTSLLQKLHTEIFRQEQGALYFATDQKGQTHAALYLIWDHETAYCWQLGADTQLRKSGAVQLLIWHTIQVTAGMGKRYNFEGSMLPHIEPVFRAFGAERKPVFQIRKFGNRFLEAAWVLLNRG